MSEEETKNKSGAESFFRIIISQLDDILCEVKDSYDNEDEPTLDRIHLDLHNLFLKIKRVKASEEKKTTPEDLANLSLAIQEASTAMIEFDCLSRAGIHTIALEPLNRAVRNVRETNRLLDELGVK